MRLSLRRGVGAMRALFADYERLYTAERFGPRAPKRPVASPLGRALFWCGAAGCWLAVPLTIPLVLFYSARVRRKRLAGR